MYFIKAGMLAGLSSKEQNDLPNNSMRAIRELVKAYPPIPPKGLDSRLTQDLKAQKDRHVGKEQAWGRYV